MEESNIENLELGNMMFNPNAIQRYKCPKYIIALLDSIDNELNRIMHNITHKEWDSPFSNTGNRFKLDNVFEVEAYNWNDDECQEYNFKYYVDKSKANMPNLEISWYKYLGRDTTMNQEIDPNVMVDIYDDIIEKLRKYEKQEMDKQDIYFSSEEDE